MSSWPIAAWLMLGGSTLLLFMGMPVALTFLGVNIIGAVLYMGGEPGLVQLVRNSVSSVTAFALTPIPLFVLMGEILFHTGLALKVIEGVERLIVRVPGRLAVVAVVGFAVFVVWELTDKHPVVDLRLFGRRNFTFGVITLSVASP